jgi:Haemolysin-type calcium binding protein related domain
VSWSYAQVQQMLLDQESAAVGGSVYGYGGNDTIIAGLGDKYLNGGGGSDTYVYTSAGGNDIIADPSNFLSTLQFADIASTDVTLSRPNGGADLIITNTVTGKTVTVRGEFANGGSLLAITFSDGVSWNQAQVEAILTGGGGGGSNTGFLFSHGDGQVTLDGSVSTVRMGAGISESDVLLQANGSGDLIVRLRDSNDTITDHHDLSINIWGVSSTVSQINFADGTSMAIGQPAAGQGAPPTFTWLDNSPYAGLTGSGFGSNVFEVTSYYGTVNFANAASVGGSNTVKYSKGAGRSDIYLNGGTGAIDFGSGVSAQDVYLEANGSGDLVVQVRNDPGDVIVVHNDLTNNSDGSVASGVNQLGFSDGSVLNIGQPAAGQGSPLTFTWLGNSPYAGLNGSGYGSNVFEISSYNVVANFANVSSVGGTNTVKYTRGSARSDVYLNGGTGAIDFGAGISAQDVYLEANGSGDLMVQIRNDATDVIVVHNDLTVHSDGTVTSGVNQLGFSDGSVLNLGQPAAGHGSPLTFTWLGNSPYAGLNGSGYGSNVFEISSYNVVANFANVSSVGGTNTVKYTRGSGRSDIYLNGGTGAIDFGIGISAQDVYLETNGSGDLIVQVRNDATDAIVVHNDLTSNADGSVASGVNQLGFSDGSVLDIGQPAAGQGSPLTFTWLGNSPYATLNGSAYGSNVFEISTYDTVVGFANASSAGGTNTVKYNKGAGRSDIDVNGATGAIDFGTGISAQDVYLEADGSGDLVVQVRNDPSDVIVVHNDLVHQSGGGSSAVNQLVFADGTTESLGQPSSGTGSPLAFTWIGTANTNLSGNSFGANIFEFGAGSETATGAKTDDGGPGSNTYKASAATGQATIYANEAPGTANELDFTGGITDNQLWFLQSGNDLRIDLLGTQTEVSVKDWFSGGSTQLQEITAGGLKIDSQVSQLVQAMASYSASNAGFDPTAASVHTLPNDANLQSSMAAAWHA